MKLKSVILTDSIDITGSRFARIESWMSRTLDLGIRKHSSKNPICNGNEKSVIFLKLRWSFRRSCSTTIPTVTCPVSAWSHKASPGRGL